MITQKEEVNALLEMLGEEHEDNIDMMSMYKVYCLGITLATCCEIYKVKS